MERCFKKSARLWFPWTQDPNRILIRRARDLGFSIDQVRDLLGLSDQRDRPCEAVDAIAREHLTEVKRKIRDLQALRRELDSILSQCSRGRSPSANGWGKISLLRGALDPSWMYQLFAAHDFTARTGGEVEVRVRLSSQDGLGPFCTSCAGSGCPSVARILYASFPLARGKEGRGRGQVDFGESIRCGLRLR